MTDDRYYGTTGNNTFDGGEGRDYILGDAGDDNLTGGAGNDRVRGGSGNDTIYGGEGNDLLRGGSGDDSIYGGEGHDSIFGDDGDDELYGGAGNDTIFGGRGDDTITGGAGEDTFAYYSVDSGNDTITDFNVDEDTIDLSLIQHNITFSQITIADNSDSTAVVITIPQSVLGPDATNDITITLTGVSASDLSEDTFIMPNPPEDSITTEGGITVLPHSDPFEGNRFSNIMGDSAESTTIYGYGGNDHIFGGEGDDTIYGGTGNDLLMGEEGDDTLVGGEGDDTLVGGSGEDTFVFEPGHGNDTIEDFSTTEDVIDLRGFHTSITWAQLSEKFSTITDPQDPNTVTGVKIDLTDFGGGTITLEGVTSTGDLTSDMFNLPIIGDGSANTLTGGRGDDRLDGGAGDDTYTGGEGADTFVFAAESGTNTITDFEDNIDTIDLTAFSSISGFTDLSGKIEQDGADTKIDLSDFGGGVIVLEDFTSTDLDASDFDFT